MAINWIDRIKQAEKKLQPWRDSARRVVDVYRGRETSDGNAVLNLHHANMKLYLATVYARTPKPECVRRKQHTQDPQGQRLSEAVKRALEYSIDEYDFDDVMESVLVDYGNTALGQVRIRYKPFFEEGPPEVIPVSVNEELRGDQLVTVYLAGNKEVDPDDVQEGPEGLFIEGKATEVLAYEQVCAEFVPWDRFGWECDVPDWSHVTFAWIEHHLTADDLKKQFKLTQKQIDELPEQSKDSDNKATLGRRFRVYEVFDKEARRVHVHMEGLDGRLMDEPDPYRLEGFFPFPKPLFGTITSDKLVPVPNYQIAQDLYKELNEVTRRIIALTKMLKVRGVYDSQHADALADILGKDDGYIAPLPNFSDAKQDGGLGGAMSFLPLEEINAVLQTLQNQRTGLINLISQIEGTTDTARGQARASETAAASRIKNEHYGIRTNREVRKVSRFVRDIFRIIAEFIAETFSLDTFNLIAQTDLSEEEFQALKSDMMRDYMIDVQTDSMLIEDEASEIEQRGHATQALGQFLTAVFPYVQQGVMSPDVAKQIILYNTRASSRGRGDLERAVEAMFAPPPAPPGMPPGPPIQ